MEFHHKVSGFQDLPHAQQVTQSPSPTKFRKHNSLLINNFNLSLCLGVPYITYIFKHILGEFQEYIFFKEQCEPWSQRIQTTVTRFDCTENLHLFTFSRNNEEREECNHIYLKRRRRSEFSHSRRNYFCSNFLKIAILLGCPQTL